MLKPYVVSQELLVVLYTAKDPETTEGMCEGIVCSPTGKAQFEDEYGHNYILPGEVVPRDVWANSPEVKRKVEIGSGWRFGRMPMRRMYDGSRRPCREYNFLRCILA